LQAFVSVSPDKKTVTNNGLSTTVGGTAIAWVTSRIGASAGLSRGWLWTSQFHELSWQPYFGAVVRTNYVYPGRLYLRYLVPTGCVWATPTNPCTLQSKRTQGPSIEQEFQVSRHFRWGLDVGIFHFCDQSNENDPAVPRTCHWAGTEMLHLRFGFHGQNPDVLY
jgi:hypothetical protein